MKQVDTINDSEIEDNEALNQAKAQLDELSSAIIILIQRLRDNNPLS